MTICEEAALQYESFDHLRSRCKLDPILTSQISRLTCSKGLTQLISITDQANNYLEKGKGEEAYQLFHRAYDISQIIHAKSQNDSSFRNSLDGRRYLDLSKDILNTLENLNDELKLRYNLREADKQNITQQQQALTLSTCNSDSSVCELKEIPILPSKNILNDDFDQYIKPQQLVQFVENQKASALILDYRMEPTKFIDYLADPNAISVVQLPASELSPGCLLSTLPFFVDISVRPLLLRIRQFDLVVLMGDTQEMEKPLEELPKNSHTWILMEALTTYNLRDSLKRRPVLLKGGFRSWDLAYSCYTKGETTRFNVEQTFYEEFGSLLDNALKASRLDINYPNLNNNFSTLGIYSSLANNQEIFIENQRVGQPVVRNVEIRRIDDSSNSNQSSIFKKPDHYMNINDLANNSQFEIPKKIPTVDRSTKPSIVHSKPLPFPRTIVEQNRALSPSNFLSNKENLHSISNESVASNLPQADRKISSEISVPLQPKRPPIPDRSTKEPLLTRPPELFQHIYHAMINDIYKSSRLGKTNCGYTGLYNLGNTCFMNSTLQALFNTPILVNLFSHQNIGKYINEANILGSRGVISGCFAALTDCIWSGEFLAIRPELFLETFAHRVNSDLADRRQHDAQEFQIFLLDALLEDTNKKGDPFPQNYNGNNLEVEAEDYLKKSKLYSSSVLNDIFNLHTISRISCTICSTSSVTFEKMNQIAVELPFVKDYTTLMECLQNHFNDLLLEGQSRWKCPECGIPQVAGRSIKIWSLPPVLVIHMKRFSPDRGEFVKNEIEVEYDISNLDMSRFLHEKAPKSRSIYSLYAVTNHDGRLNSGHYTAFVKNYQSQEWLKFDDDNCSRISASSVKVGDHEFLTSIEFLQQHGILHSSRLFRLGHDMKLYLSTQNRWCCNLAELGAATELTELKKTYELAIGKVAAAC